jgi:hypothetical protein
MGKTLFWLIVANEIRGLVTVALVLWGAYAG